MLSPSAAQVALHTNVSRPRRDLAKMACEPMTLRRADTASTPNAVPTNLQMQVRSTTAFGKRSSAMHFATSPRVRVMKLPMTASVWE